MVGRDCGGEDNERILRRAHILGDKVDVVLVVHLGTLSLEGARKGCRSAVVARHAVALVHVVARKGTHADAANTEEVYLRIVALHTPIDAFQ